MSNTASMPRGVEAGGVLARVVAYLIDGIPPAIVYGILGLVLAQHNHGTLQLVASVVGGLLVFAWAIAVWWGLAVRGAGPGMRAMGLQLVGIKDGRPIGWGRVFLRQLVLSIVLGTGIGGILLLVFLLTHPQRQGWHDLAVKAVVVKAPKRAGAGSAGMGALAKQQVAASATTTVGLPPRLAQQQAGFAGTTAPGSWQETSAPAAGPINSIPGFSPASSASSASAPASAPSATPYPASAPSASGYGAPTGSAPSPQAPAWGGPAAAPATAWGQQATSSQPPVQAPVSQPSAPVSQPSAGAAFGQPFTPPPAQAAPVSQAASGVGGAHTLPAVSQPSAAQFDADATSAGAPVVQEWRLTFDDGRTVDVDGVVLVGRDPVAKAGETARLIAMGEGSKKASKTHLMVAVDARGIYLMDRGSTNGTAVVMDNGDFQPCPPGEIVRLNNGQGVSFGDHWFTVAKKA